MEIPDEALKCRSFCQKPPSTPATTPNTAMHPFFLNQVLLHDWWLIKADSDTHGKRLGVGGFTFKKGVETIRCFSSTPVVKCLDAVTLKTDDGMIVMLIGCVNKSRTLENGFSHEICDHFLIGFPYDWEEFAVLSEASGANKETSLPLQGMKEGKIKAGKERSDVEHSGPLTRSRARLWDN